MRARAPSLCLRISAKHWCYSRGCTADGHTIVERDPLAIISCAPGIVGAIERSSGGLARVVRVSARAQRRGASVFRCWASDQRPRTWNTSPTRT
jgi:hypothetical protein